MSEELQNINKIQSQFEENLDKILKKECDLQLKNTLLKGQMQMIRLAIQEQQILKGQKETKKKELEKVQVMKSLSQEQERIIEEKELQLIQKKKDLHIQQDASEDLQFEIEQQKQFLRQELENSKILDTSISRLMDSVQKLKRSPVKQQSHSRVATSQSFDDHQYFGFMGILRSRNNVDDYIEKVEKFNTSRMHDH